VAVYILLPTTAAQQTGSWRAIRLVAQSPHLRIQPVKVTMLGRSCDYGKPTQLLEASSAEPNFKALQAGPRLDLPLAVCVYSAKREFPGKMEQKQTIPCHTLAIFQTQNM
jgi:hypothetical protein